MSITRQRPALAVLACPSAETVVFHNPGCASVCFGAAGVQDQDRDSLGGARHMRNRKAAEVDADVEARIAQIEQMTLEQIATFQGRMLADIATGRSQRHRSRS